MALPIGGTISASMINTESATVSTNNAPLSGNSSTPQAGSLVKLYEGAGVNQSAPHSYSEFYGKSFVGVLTDVYQSYPNYSDYYYNSSIGNAIDLSNGDVIYTDTSLTTTLSAGTYYQEGSSEATTRCINGSYLMSMTVNSSGAITNIFCAQP